MEEVQIGEAERRGSEENAEREEERKENYARPSGLSNFFVFRQFRVCVCFQVRCVGGTPSLPSVTPHSTSLRAELFACFLPRCTRIQLIMNS